VIIRSESVQPTLSLPEYKRVRKGARPSSFLFFSPLKRCRRLKIKDGHLPSARGPTLLLLLPFPPPFPPLLLFFSFFSAWHTGPACKNGGGGVGTEPLLSVSPFFPLLFFFLSMAAAGSQEGRGGAAGSGRVALTFVGLGCLPPPPFSSFPPPFSFPSLSFFPDCGPMDWTSVGGRMRKRNAGPLVTPCEG